MTKERDQDRKTYYSIASFIFGIVTILAMFIAEEAIRMMIESSGHANPEPVKECVCEFSIPIEAYFCFATIILAVLSITFGLLSITKKEQKSKLIFTIIGFCLSLFSITPMIYDLSKTRFKSCYGITENGTRVSESISICPGDAQKLREYYRDGYYDYYDDITP